jgi:hypothetical protein
MQLGIAKLKGESPMNISIRAITLISALAMAGGVELAALPAAAQYDQVPPFTTWQPGWDSYQYDHRHVMLGTVDSFAPYRLTLTRRNGVTQTIDLKRGTAILPVGATPTAGERVAIVGYYSNGTFIANRVILRA